MKASPSCTHNCTEHPTKRLFALLGLLLVGFVLAAPTPRDLNPNSSGSNSSSSNDGCSASTPTLSKQLGLEPSGLFNVLEATERASYARYRIVARLSPSGVAQRFGEALNEASQGGWEEVLVQNKATKPIPVGGLSRGSVHHTRYVNEASAQALSVQVQGVGRSNLFTLELRLDPLSTSNDAP